MDSGSGTTRAYAEEIPKVEPRIGADQCLSPHSKAFEGDYSVESHKALCASRMEPPWGHTKSLRPSVRGEWVRCIAPGTRAWTASSQLRSCPRISLTSRNG